MEQGKNMIKVEYRHGLIKDFEKRVLAEGRCGAFLPMSFVAAGGKEMAYCDCSGYRPLGDIEFKNSREIVFFLEKCVLALIDSCGYLIDTRRMDLNAETVFFSVCTNEVKFTYVPGEAPAEKVLDVLKKLLERLENCLHSKEMQNYVRAVMTHIESFNGSLFDVLNCIGELKRELFACGWETR